LLPQQVGKDLFDMVGVRRVGVTEEGVLPDVKLSRNYGIAT